MEPSAVRAGVPMALPYCPSEGEESATSQEEVAAAAEQPKKEAAAAEQSKKEAEPKEEVKQEGSVAKRMRIHGPGNGAELDTARRWTRCTSRSIALPCGASCRAAPPGPSACARTCSAFSTAATSQFGGDTQELVVMYRELPGINGKNRRRYSGAKLLKEDDGSAPPVCVRAHKQGLSEYEATRGLFSMTKIVKELGRAGLPIADLDIVHAAPVLQHRRHPDKPCLERLVKDRETCYKELGCSREAPTFSNRFATNLVF